MKDVQKGTAHPGPATEGVATVVRLLGARVKTLMNLPCARVMNYLPVSTLCDDLHSCAVTGLAGKIGGVGEAG